MSPSLTVFALRVTQRIGVPMYAFGIEGRLVSQFARAHHAQMNDSGDLDGYQRPEIAAHIREIRQYLESEGAILPNALVLAFDDRVSFEPFAGIQPEWGTPGKLKIPLPTATDRSKCALIIDGQQRSRALAEMSAHISFPVLVVGFVAPTESFQREQFILVNSAKPLPRDLLHKLVPDSGCVLPKRLETTRVPTRIANRVCYRRHSPFYQRVKGIAPDGDIAYASLLDAAKLNLKASGAFNSSLYITSDGQPNVDAMSEAIIAFFGGVAAVWPDAWRLGPERSRLTHGAGITSMAAVMAHLAPKADLLGSMGTLQVRQLLAPMKEKCAWTSGTWPLLGRAWNELQNTSADKKLLTEYLLGLF